MTPPLRIFGHERLRSIFDELLAKEKLPHALLFMGPEGIGKSLFARALAMRAFCRQRSVPVPWPACGACESCQRFARGQHPDLLFFTTEANGIKIDDVREIQKQLRFQPLYETRRFLIIPDADRLTVQAQNAFLRTLEEPRANNHFILTTANADSLLPTIRSRAQTHRFAPLSADDFFQFLSAQGQAVENVEPLYKLSGGIPGTALRLLDGDSLMFHDDLQKRLRRLAMTKKPEERDWEIASWVKHLAPAKDKKHIIVRGLMSTFHAYAHHQVEQTESAPMPLMNVATLSFDTLFKCYASCRRAEHDFEHFTNYELTLTRLFQEIDGALHGER